jgi:hypothetical protein
MVRNIQLPVFDCDFIAGRRSEVGVGHGESVLTQEIRNPKLEIRNGDSGRRDEGAGYTSLRAPRAKLFEFLISSGAQRHRPPIFFSSGKLANFEFLEYNPSPL